MAVIGDLVATLTADTSKFDKRISGSRSTLGDFVSSLSRIPVGVAGIIGAAGLSFAGLVAGITSSVSAAAEAEAAERKLASVIKSTGGAAGLSAAEIMDYAAERQKLTNFDADATDSAAGVLATFTSIRGDVFKDAIASAQDLSSVFGQDLQSSMTQVGKALNDPIKGVSALSRVGVSFTDAQKKSIEGLVRAGDMAGAQRVILSELAREVGGAAVNMADPMQQFQNVIGDVQENVGAVFLPMVREIASGFIEAVGPVQEGTDVFASLGETLGAITRDVISPVISGVKTAGAAVVEFADGSGFAFRNFSDLAQLALIELQLAIFDLLPGSEKVFENLGGLMVATWDASAAGFSSYLDRVKGGFEELGQVVMAIAAAQMAALEAAFSGENPITAYKDEFLKTFASQTDVKDSGSPIDAFAKSFAETRDAVREGFASSGGLGGDLRAERERLLDQIGSRESAFAASKVPEESGPAAADSATSGLVLPKLAAALEKGSAEALSVINKAGAGKPEPIEKVAELSKQQLTEQRKIANELARQNRAGRPLVFSV